MTSIGPQVDQLIEKQANERSAFFDNLKTKKLVVRNHDNLSYNGRVVKFGWIPNNLYENMYMRMERKDKKGFLATSVEMSLNNVFIEGEL